MNQTFADQIDKLLSTAVLKQRFSGTVLIHQGNEDLYRRAFGFANRTWKIKNTPETRFRIASVGKQFTAAAILQLIAAGKITLQTRVPELLGLENSQIPTEVNVYHLLTMTSGIADWIDEESETYNEDWITFCRENPLYLLRSDVDYLPIFMHKKPYDPIGKKHHYNGAGFMLLGLLIEKISSMTYFEYIRRHIFEPCGMTGSDFLDLDDTAENVAEGYIPITDENGKNLGWRKNIYAATAGPAADGGATSTVDDLLKFARALRQGKLCAADLVKEMFTPRMVASATKNPKLFWYYGFGSFILKEDTGPILCQGHTGEEDGVSCRLWYYPKQDMDVILLGNQSECAGSVTQEIQKIIFSEK
jgi:CubicO group peptidase (beta-lactamase class C family)